MSTDIRAFGVLKPCPPQLPHPAPPGVPQRNPAPYNSFVRPPKLFGWSSPPFGPLPGGAAAPHVRARTPLASLGWPRAAHPAPAPSQCDKAHSSTSTPALATGVRTSPRMQPPTPQQAQGRHTPQSGASARAAPSDTCAAPKPTLPGEGPGRHRRLRQQ